MGQLPGDGVCEVLRKRVGGDKRDQKQLTPVPGICRALELVWEGLTTPLKLFQASRSLLSSWRMRNTDGIKKEKKKENLTDNKW